MAEFAQITSGPATTTGQNPNQQSLIMDKASDIVEAVGAAGIAQALQTSLVITGPLTAITAVTTAQNLFSRLLNPGVLNKQTRALEIIAAGVYTTPGTTTPAMTFAITFGGVSLCSITVSAASATASTNMPFNIYFTLVVTTTGTAGVIEAHGEVNINLSANTPAAQIASFNDTNAAGSAAVNLVTAGTLAITAAATSAVSSIQLRQLQVNVIN